MVAGLAVQISVGARLQSDGFYYYAYLRSMAFDHDVDFTNDYRMLGLGDKANLFQPTPTGHAQSAWTIGPSIVWAPFFGAGHLVARSLHRHHPEIAVDGTSFPYRQAVCIAGLFYGLLGCWCCWRLTRRVRPESPAATAVILTVAGSFLLWYFVKEPSMTHAPSMASVAGVVWLWAATREHRAPRMWGWLGLLVGLSGLIRWQNLLFALLPAIDAAVALLRGVRQHDRAAVRRTAASSAIFLAALLVGFLPQMLAWKSIYGSYVARSPVGPQVRWFDPHLVDILWSARNGLLSTSPMLYLAAIGLVLVAMESPSVGLPMLATVAVMVYFNACIQDWWGSAGFGGRRFDGTIPIFCVGLAAFIDALARWIARRPRTALTVVLSVLVISHAGLMGAAQNGTVHIGETIRFDRAWAAEDAVVHRWFGNPFTYPASLVFAIRNDVSPGDYDLLSTNRFLGDPLKPYGRIDIGTSDDPIEGDGWYGPEDDGAATFRWTAADAVVLVALDHAAPLMVQIRAHALAFPGAPTQTMTLAAGDRSCGPVPLPETWATAGCVLDRAAWRSGVNRLRVRFAYQRRPMDVGAGGDPRPLAAAIDWIRVSVTSPSTAR